MRQNTRNNLIKTFVGALLTIIVSMSFLSMSAKADTPDHTHNDSTFRVWSESSSLPTDGKYYLTNDVNLKKDLSVYNMLSICLNGHKICPAGNVRIFVHDGAVLNIVDCDEDKKYYFKDEYDPTAYWVPGDESTGDQVVTGGAITGFNNNGVFEVRAGGILNIFGGNIVGNSSNNGTYGGAITLTGGNDPAKCATVNISGGRIIGNASFGSAKGGAIYMTGNSYLNLAGGIISNNYTDSDGGAIYIDKGTVNLNGGLITNNRASTYGGGVYNCGNLVMYDGEISHNSSTINGAGIYNKNSITLLGGSVTGNTINASAARYGAGIFCEVNSTNEVGGTAKIYNNSNNSSENPLNESNIHLQNYNGVAKVTLLTGNDALKDGADVRVTVYDIKTSDWKAGHVIESYFNNLSTDNCKYISMNNSVYVDTILVDNTLYKVHNENRGFTLYDPNDDYEIVPYDYQGHKIYAYSDDSLNNQIEESKFDKKVYIKIIPKAGYSYNANDISVNCQNGGACQVSPVQGVNDVYYFTMPADKVNLSANFTQNKSSVSNPPTGFSQLVFNGGLQKLIDFHGTAENGTIVYCIGNDSTTIPLATDPGWSTDIPKGRIPGEYYIWYKSKGSAGYADSDINTYCRVVTTINKQEGMFNENMAPEDLTAVKPSTYGASDGKIIGTDIEMYYTTQNIDYKNAERKHCSDGETTGLAAGTYYVFFYDASEYREISFSSYTTIVIPDGDRPLPPDNDPTPTPPDNNPVDPEPDNNLADPEPDTKDEEKPADSEKNDKQKEDKKDKKDKKDTQYSNGITLSSGIAIAQKGKKINVSWGLVDDADGYTIYGGYYGKGKTKLLKTVKGNDKTDISISKLDKKAIDSSKTFRFYVEAYKNIDGEKTSIGKSIVVYLAGEKNSSFSDVIEVKPNKKSLEIKEGSSKSIKATLVLADESKRIFDKGSVPALRFRSSDKSIATVTSKGKIKTHASGTCTIYLYAPNGCCAEVKIVVK